MTRMAGDAVQPRRNRDSEILDAAITVFSQRGYSGASLQEIAERVGILKGSLYHYIDSKESLLFRILEENHHKASEIQQEVDALRLPTEEKFVAYITRLSTWYLTNLERTSLYQNEWRFLEGDFGRKVKAYQRSFTGYLRAIVDAAVDEGLAAPDLDTDLVTKFVLSAIDSVPSWYRVTPPRRIDDVADSITAIAHAAVFAPRGGRR